MNEIKRVNYDLVMQKIATESMGKSLLLHACCAPCSSSVLKRLIPFFNLTIFYYNPNIDTEKEYKKRGCELERLINIYNEKLLPKKPIKLILNPYNSEDFKRIAKGFETCHEGGARCVRCYKMRLLATYERAKQNGFAFFCSTLSVSPHKKVEIINQIGSSIVQNDTASKNESFFPMYLPNDFKKRNGYLDSINMSKELGLYRQDYCGCAFSKQHGID